MKYVLLAAVLAACKLHAEPGAGPTDDGGVPGTTTCTAAIGTGTEHACAVRDDGAVYCWGRNDSGQLGNNSTTDSVVPVQVMMSGNTPAALSDAIDVVGGDSHTCAIVMGGAVWCWGHNDLGQVGDGSTTDAKAALQVQGVTGATFVGAGYKHSCALIGDGVTCWGGNQEGELGDGTFSSRGTAMPVPSLTSGVVELATYDQTNCVVKTDGSVWCWGENYNGELGSGATSNPVNVPVQVPQVSGAVHVALMEQAGCAVTAGGTVCWGRDHNGELGNANSNDNVFAAMPTQIPIALTQMSGGDAHLCGVSGTGDAWCWGQGRDGRLFDLGDSIEPAPHRTNLGPVTHVSGGFAYSCALLASKGIACAGYNARGNLGDGSRSTESVPAPVPRITGVTQIAAGEESTCVLISGAVWCWGANYVGQLGIGSTSDVTAPVQMILPMAAKQISMSDERTCALLVNGTVMCAGNNTYGQLGTGDQNGSNKPVAVTMLSNVTQVQAGYSHTCALLADKTVKCWGYPGEVGTNAMANVLTPTALSLTNITALGGTGGFTCALDGMGQVWCWGYGGDGEVGDGTTTTFVGAPEMVLTGVKSLYSGESHTCAVKASGGGVVCWGYNFASELGDGSYQSRSAPTPISFPLDEPAEMAIGDGHTCALIGGALKCWGFGAWGQLGDGTSNRLQIRGVTVPCE